MTTAITDLAAFLSGRWTLERHIEDLANGTSGRLDGEVRFATDGAGLSYTETGQLQLAEIALPARRCYRYRFPRPYRAQVSFEDGRAFHELDLRTGGWRAEHRCGADLYRGAFRVIDADRWRIAWSVTGPRKHLRLISWLRRA